MGWFNRTKYYDRSRIIREATHARAKQRWKKAIALYRRVLAVEPHDTQLHAKIAPMLARTGQHFDAMLSFRVVAKAFLRERRGNEALAVYRAATGHLPREIQIWESIARLEVKRGDSQAAVEALIEGASKFKSRRHRPQAIHLLRNAHEVEPWDFEATFELARLLGKSDRIEEARRLLDGLAERNGDCLRRLMAAQFRLDGDLRYGWRWLRAEARPLAEAPYGPGRI